MALTLTQLPKFSSNGLSISFSYNQTISTPPDFNIFKLNFVLESKETGSWVPMGGPGVVTTATISVKTITLNFNNVPAYHIKPLISEGKLRLKYNKGQSGDNIIKSSGSVANPFTKLINGDDLVKIDTIKADSTGMQIIVTYEVSIGGTVDKSQFTVSSNTVTSANIAGNKVTLGLGTKINNGDSVTLGYTRNPNNASNFFDSQNGQIYEASFTNKDVDTSEVTGGQQQQQAPAGNSINNFFNTMNNSFLSNAPRSQGGVNWEEYGSVNTHTLKGLKNNPTDNVVCSKNTDNNCVKRFNDQSLFKGANNYYGNQIKTNTDISGYIMGCAKTVDKAGYKYALITTENDTGGNPTDKFACYGGNDLSQNNYDNNIYKLDSGRDKAITISAESFIKKIQDEPVRRGDYTGITCEIVNHNNEWICASNCVFKGGGGAGRWSSKDGNIDMYDDISWNVTEEKGNRWRRQPPSGVIKHNEHHKFTCNNQDGFYYDRNPVMTSSGTATYPHTREENRKCSFGTLGDVQPVNGESKYLKCTNVENVNTKGCVPITNVDDPNCLTKLQQVEDGKNSDGKTRYKYYKYCPVNCNANTQSKACKSHSDCKNSLFQHNPGDKNKNVPYNNPYDSGDPKGYLRIEVDANGKSMAEKNARLTNAQMYSNLVKRHSADIPGQGTDAEINMDVLENGTISGLLSHMFNSMKIKDMATMFDGISNYFNVNKTKVETKWMNDDLFSSSTELKKDPVMSSLDKMGETSLPYTTGGNHLLSTELSQGPSQFKNNNQYIAIARNELYNSKTDSNEKILNPETVPQASMIQLGKIIDKIKLLKKEQNQRYLTEDQRYGYKMKIARLHGEQMKIMKDIKYREKQYSRTVKEGKGRIPFKPDNNYVAFAGGQQAQKTYTSASGKKMNVPTGVGGNF